eukprot:scaffold5342_cov67-Phaeocystis_antarctica.AAC.2
MTCAPTTSFFSAASCTRSLISSVRMIRPRARRQPASTSPTTACWRGASSSCMSYASLWLYGEGSTIRRELGMIAWAKRRGCPAEPARPEAGSPT